MKRDIAFLAVLAVIVIGSIGGVFYRAVETAGELPAICAAAPTDCTAIAQAQAEALIWEDR